MQNLALINLFLLVALFIHLGIIQYRLKNALIKPNLYDHVDSKDWVEWIKLAESQEGGIAALELYSIVFRRFTEIEEVYDKFFEFMGKEYKNSNDINYKITLLEKMGEINAIFMNYCKKSSWEKLKKQQKDNKIRLLKDIEEAMSEKVEKEKNILEEYEKEINLYMRKSDPTLQDKEKLAEYENKVNRILIKENEELKSKYKQLRNKLLDHINKKQETKKIDFQYNRKHVNEAKELLDKMDNLLTIKNRVNPKGEKLDIHDFLKLNDVDFDRLVPEAAQYILFVKNHIFSKLDADEKFDFTKQSIEKGENHEKSKR